MVVEVGTAWLLDVVAHRLRAMSGGSRVYAHPWHTACPACMWED